MRSSLKNTFAASLAALTIGLAVLSPAPASAGNWHPGGHHGFWGPGLALGFLGVAAAGAAAYSAEDDCVRYRPIYDRWGNLVGRGPVNVCQ